MEALEWELSTGDDGFGAAVHSCSQQVLADSTEMECGADEDEAMPDGVGKWDDAIALKEDDPQHIDKSSHGYFL